MKDKHDIDSTSRPQSFSNNVNDRDDDDEANGLFDSDSHYIVVQLEDEDKTSECEMDLSIFAPVESSESEEDEDKLSDSCGISTWRRADDREKDEREDAASQEIPSSSMSFKREDMTTRQDHNPDSSSVNRAKNECVSGEKPTFQPALPQSSSYTCPTEMSGLHTVISPLTAMEPPVFPNTPVLSKSVVGEDQQNILLEILNHCRFLHAAVERLEQKIDRQMTYEAKLPIEEGSLSWSLAQRLGPPVKRNQQWIPPWKRNTAQDGLNRADLGVDNSSLQLANPSAGGRGRGRGRGRGKGRGGRGHDNRSKRQSGTPDLAQHMSEALRDGISTVEMDDPQPSKMMKKGSQFKTGSKAQKKRRKGLAQVDEHQVYPEKTFNKKEVTVQVDVNKNVMIGSPLRKVWIPLSVYKEAFKEAEPQKALVPVLYSLFTSSTLSSSAITGNHDKGIKQLDPNKIEALREFLAEMFPQYDVSLRGVTWPLCVGVINNITKALRKKAEKPSHLPEKAADSGNNAVFIQTSKDLFC
ncbi:uncharacterized protein [Misgurnus anguillicaudatus]|uniref:uncharacterized protein n=1 Tax=Misgurnus anguillicaudatus TaxID=75329 RepID=UPI003CCF5131